MPLRQKRMRNVMSRSHLDRSRTLNILRPAMIGAAALLLGLAACSSNVADPDLWGHIQYGREVIQSGQLPRTATWTYVAEGAPWVNHEIIAELLLALCFDQFGTPGLIAMKMLFGTLMFGAMIFAARRSGANWFVTSVVTAIVGANIQFHWHYRPQVLTYFSLAMLLLIWQRIFRNESAAEFFGNPVSMKRLNLFWLVVPIMIFWTNSHGGFAAGLAIICAYHGLLTLQVLWADGFSPLRGLVRLWSVTVAVIAASLINPYGIDHWKFMFDALVLPRPEISDWQPLNLWDRDAVRFWSLLGLSLMGFATTLQAVASTPESDRSEQCQSWGSRVCRKLSAGQNLPQWIVFTLLLWQGMSHCRHMAIVAIVFGFWMPRHLQPAADRMLQAFRRIQSRQPDMASDRPGTHFVPPGLLVPVCVIAICVIRVGRDSTDIAVDRAEFPVSAMQFVSDHRLEGKMLVTFNWAQYAIGCFGASDSRLDQSKVAVDGRFETCYPREITDICFDFWLGTDDPRQRYRSPTAPPFDPTAALELNQPDLVLISRHQRPSVRIMEQQSHNWMLLYQDTLAQLWGRRTVYESVAGTTEDSFRDATMRHSDSSLQETGNVSFPALPHPASLQGLMSSRASVDDAL